MEWNVKLFFLIVAFIIITGMYLFIKSHNTKQTQSSVVTNKPKTIVFKSKDNLPITGDLYLTKNLKSPYIILFHQAYYSRGEYTEIAPKLNKLGFNCLAIDQRSGNEVNGIVNQTNLAAAKLGMATEYTDAYKDLEASLQYVKNVLKAEKIIVWGSSYSASLVIVLGYNYHNHISGILSFSPGEYFVIDNKKVEDYASNIKCPIFFTSEKSAVAGWQAIYDRAPAKERVSYIPAVEGNHGSSAIYECYDFSKEYWIAVKKFLKKFQN